MAGAHREPSNPPAPPPLAAPEWRAAERPKWGAPAADAGRDAAAGAGRDAGSAGGDCGRFEDRIKVAVRKRPLFKKEAERGDVDVLQADNSQSITVSAAVPI